LVLGHRADTLAPWSHVAAAGSRLVSLRILRRAMPTAVYNLAALLSWPVVRGLYRLPAEGGFVLAANHASSFDPWPLGMPLWPRRQLHFMAKAELFKPVL